MELIDLSNTGENDSRFDEVLFRICADVGASEATFGLICPRSGGLRGYSTWGRDDTGEKASVEYHTADDALRRAMKSATPVDWSRLIDCLDDDEIVPKKKSAARPRQGVTIPVRGVMGEAAGLWITSDLEDDAWFELKRRHMKDLQRRAAHLLEMTRAEGDIGTLVTRRSLSARELDVLKLSNEGRGRAEIATKLGMSERTVEIYCDSLKTKLSALTMMHAVGRACMFGLVEP